MPIHKFYLVITIALLSLLVISCSSRTTDLSFHYFPKLNAPKHLFVIQESSMTKEELIMVETLQGILAKEKPQIYITNAYNAKWLDDLQQNYGVTIEQAADAWSLIDKFKEKLKGFIVYESLTPSVNVATTLAGIKQTIAVDKSIVDKATKLGLPLVEDVSDKDDVWAFKTYGEQLSKDFLIQQDPKMGQLRDYGVAHNAMYMFNITDVGDLASIMKHTNLDSPRLGWGPGDEATHVGIASTLGKFTVASDWAMNLSALSGVKVKKPFQQTFHPAVGKVEQAVHYVSFIMSDGDNVQWLLNDFAQNDKWFGSSVRGKFPMGWQMAPTLSDLAPSAMSWFYSHAKQDYFVAGVSGLGYFYPSSYPADALKLNMERFDDYLKTTDMQITTILDNQEPKQEVLAAYASIPSLKGAVIGYGDRYKGGGGVLKWFNNKPFASFRESLWETDPAAMADRINKYPRDSSKAEGYTFINVHPWSHTMQDVKTVVDHLDAHVKVVSPEELIARMTRDVER